MLDALLSTISPADILVGIVGQIANDASAKLTLAGVKAIGVAMFGSIFSPDDQLPKAARRETSRRKHRRKVRARTSRSKRRNQRPSRGKRG